MVASWDATVVSFARELPIISSCMQDYTSFPFRKGDLNGKEYWEKKCELQAGQKPGLLPRLLRPSVNPLPSRNSWTVRFHRFSATGAILPASDAWRVERIR